MTFKLFIAVPSYGYKCFTPFVESMLKLQHLVDKTEDVELEVKFIPQESLITRARNTLVSYFLRSDCTHLMFIDADIEFHAEDVIEMLTRNKDFVVGAYPHKSLIKIDGYSDQACFNYSINMKKETVSVENSLMEIEYGATGFMMLKRNVLTTMIEKYADLKYVNDVAVNEELGKEYYALFDCIIDPDSKRYLSEDFTFCKRWRDIGGKIYLDLCVNLTHIGVKKYDGSIFIKFTETGILRMADNVEKLD